MRHFIGNAHPLLSLAMIAIVVAGGSALSSGRALAQADPAVESTMPAPRPVDPDAAPPEIADPAAVAPAPSDQAEPTPIPFDPELLDTGPVGAPEAEPMPVGATSSGDTALPVWLPFALLPVALLSGFIGYWWYGKFLESVLRARIIRSPSNHMTSSIGVALSSFGGLASLATPGTLPFFFAVLPVLGVILNFTGSRHPTGYAIALVSLAICVARGVWGLATG